METLKGGIFLQTGAENIISFPVGYNSQINHTHLQWVQKFWINLSLLRATSSFCLRYSSPLSRVCTGTRSQNTNATPRLSHRSMLSNRVLLQYIQTEIIHTRYALSRYMPIRILLLITEELKSFIVD